MATQAEARSKALAIAEAETDQNTHFSFGAALIGFMVTTTLTTSLLVLLNG